MDVEEREREGEDCQNSRNCPGISHHFGTSHISPSPSFILLLGGDGEKKEKQNRRTGCWLEVNSCGFVVMPNIYPPTSFTPRISSSSPGKFVLASWISSTLLCVCDKREDGRTRGRGRATPLSSTLPPSLPGLSSPLLLPLPLRPHPVPIHGWHGIIQHRTYSYEEI